MQTLRFLMRIFTLVVVCFSGVAIAQTTGKVITASTTRSASSALPFGPGEVLNYEAKISKIISGIPIADLTFSVLKNPDSDALLIRSDAKSKGTLVKMFRFSFQQQFETVIDTAHFRTASTRKHDVQKDRVRDSEAVFDYDEKQVIFTETNPKEPMKPPRRIASHIDGLTYDLVTGIYALRLLPLAVGKTFRLQVSDSGLVYDIPVKVAAREIQKTVLGRVMCFRVEPDVFGPGRIIEREGSMAIWITDDPRRIPVRSLVNSPVGKVDVRLRSASHSK
jgi:hypothetical protein